MFKKTIIVKFHTEFKGGYSNSETDGLKPNDFLSYVKKLSDKYGKIVIEHIDTKDNKIHLTTQDSLEFARVDQEVAQISNLIRDYIVEKAH